MANTLLTPTQVLRKAGQIFHQKLNFIGSIDRQYDDSFAQRGAKIGDTLKIRLANEHTVRTGINMGAQDTTETSVDLTMATIKGVDLYFTSEELTLDIDDFSARHIEPAMTRLAANVEADALNMYKDVYNLYDGDAAAFAFASVTAARERLNSTLTSPSNRTLLLNSTHATKYLNDTKGLFHSSEAISTQYRQGKIGQVAGFENIYENTLLVPHTTGTAVKATTYTVNGAVTTNGATTVTVQTGTTTFKKGDVFTVADCNRVHPESKADTGVAQQFVVTADYAGGAGDVSFSPAIYTSGGKQNVVAAGMGNGKAITKVGAAASETLVQSMAYAKNAFAFVTADLPLPQGVDWAKTETIDGVRMSMVRDFQISDRSFPCRIDILYGYKTVYPQSAVRIHNDA